MNIEADIFIRNPSYALVPGCLFLCVGLLLAPSAKRIGTSVHISFFAVGALWTFYAFYEYLMGRLGMNIRADIFLIYPLLAGCSLAAAVHAILAPRKREE